MTKNINVNPDHYKVAGRERQGEDILQEEHKQRFTKAEERAKGDDEPRSAPPEKSGK